MVAEPALVSRTGSGELGADMRLAEPAARCGCRSSGARGAQLVQVEKLGAQTLRRQIQAFTYVDERQRPAAVVRCHPAKRLAVDTLVAAMARVLVLRQV